jgi:MFS family permease
MLLLGRIIQAFGAAMLFCVGPALIAAYFEKDRGEKIGILSMIVSAGLLVGPAVAGQVLTHFDWHALFWMEIPLVLGAFIFGLRVIPKDPERVETGLSRNKFDALGALSQAVILISFFIYLDAPMSHGKQIAVLGVLFAAIGLFFFAERHHSSPIFDFALLRRKRFAIGNILTFLNHLSFSTIFVLMPFFMEEVLHFSAQSSGLYMATIPAIMFVISPISGWWSDRIGSRGMVLAGTIIISSCLLWMSGYIGGGLSAFSTSFALILNLGVVGFAMAVFQSPNNNSIMSVVPKAELGTASAMVATIRNLGMVAGTSFATGVFTWRQNVDGDFLAALHFTHFSAFLVATLSFGAALLQISRLFEKRPGNGTP